MPGMVPFASLRVTDNKNLPKRDTSRVGRFCRR